MKHHSYARLLRATHGVVGTLAVALVLGFHSTSASAAEDPSTIESCLSRIADHHARASERAGAARWLSRQGPATTQEWLRLVVEDGRPAVRKYLALAVGMTTFERELQPGEASRLSQILERAAEDSDPEVASNAALSLGMICSIDFGVAFPALQRIAADLSLTIPARESALYSLGMLGAAGAAALPTAAGIVLHEKAASLRQHAAWVIARTSGADDIRTAVVIAALTEKRADVRAAMTFTLGTFVNHSDQVMPALTVLENDSSPLVRLTAKATLEVLQSRSADVERD